MCRTIRKEILQVSEKEAVFQREIFLSKKSWNPLYHKDSSYSYFLEIRIKKRCF